MTPTNAKTAALETLIEAHAIELKLPTVRRRFRQLAADSTSAATADPATRPLLILRAIPM
jgi:hypothetical protein